jgi:hypothetical protein
MRASRRPDNPNFVEFKSLLFKLLIGPYVVSNVRVSPKHQTHICDGLGGGGIIMACLNSPSCPSIPSTKLRSIECLRLTLKGLAFSYLAKGDSRHKSTSQEHISDRRRLAQNGSLFLSEPIISCL